MWFLPHRLGKAMHPMKPYGLKFKKKKKKGGGGGGKGEKEDEEENDKKEKIDRPN